MAEKKILSIRKLDTFSLSLIILAILSSVFLITKYLPKKSPIQKNLFPNVNPDKISITYQGKTASFEKNQDKWLIANKTGQPETNQDKITNIINQLKTLKQEELVSQNSKNHEKYGVDESQAITLNLRQNNQDIYLLIGLPGPDFESNYIRLPNEDNVYLSNLALRSLLIQPEWFAEDSQ